ncbi:hypothetical protein Poli38472_003284 [Pythium oligandrum]|uniref:Uncharacterized protein n=1 Tax=Pythium oligandrum TaxID=41045 RepID=A0A8K1FDX2_PYTOL|nr:hypothetical protein Poli38472_003284 [Pythium oligandrum]|eukprot:TMW57359.1 hypothetical protein Poli38472_003284 [Pythium oligandrum]
MPTESVAPQRGLAPKKRIGGQGAPVNYSFEERVFSTNDTASDKAAAKQEVVESLKSKLLFNDKPEWNISTSNYDNMQMTGKCYHRTNVNAERNRTNMYAYNFRAEKLPKKWPTIKPKTNRFNMGILEVALKDEYMGETFGDERMTRGYSKRVEELPNHPDLRDKTPWNPSTEAKPPMQTDQFKQFETDRQARSLRTKVKVESSCQYKSPEELAKEENERLRQEKAAKVAQLAHEAKMAALRRY